MSLRKPTSPGGHLHASPFEPAGPLGWRQAGKRKQPKVGRGSEGAHHSGVPKVGWCLAVSSGLGGEEQIGESPAAAVSVHKGQGVLHVMLNHGGHRGEELHKAGRASVGPLSFSLPTAF